MRAGTRKVGVRLAVVESDAVAFPWWVGEGFRTVAKLAVFAGPTAAKVGVAGAEVAVVVAVGEAASATVGASPRVASQDNIAYSCGPLLAVSFAVPTQLFERKKKKKGLILSA